VNRQCGLGNSKYAVILDPLPTGHVTRRMRSELLALIMGTCKFEGLYLPNSARQTHRHSGLPIGRILSCDYALFKYFQFRI